MRVHLDVLGWLYIACGAFGVLTGASLAILASGTAVALASRAVVGLSAQPTIWLLTFAASLLSVGGIVMVVVGRDLTRRGSSGRLAALLLAAPNLLIVPFGTALGIYTYWTLLNDEARREFGRPLRSPQ